MIKDTWRYVGTQVPRASLFLVDVDLKLMATAATEKRESPGQRIMCRLTTFLYHLKWKRKGRGKCQLSGVHSFTIKQTWLYNLVPWGWRGGLCLNVLLSLLQISVPYPWLLSTTMG